MKTKIQSLQIAPLLLALVSTLNAQPTFSDANWLGLGGLPGTDGEVMDQSSRPLATVIWAVPFSSSSLIFPDRVEPKKAHYCLDVSDLEEKRSEKKQNSMNSATPNGRRRFENLKTRCGIGLAALGCGAALPACADYASAVSSLQPVVYYRLNETAPSNTYPPALNSGTFGAAGNGTYLPGTTPGVVGPPFSGLGPSARACQFNGVNGYVDISASGGVASANISGALTLMAWIKRDAWTNGYQYIVGRGDYCYRLQRGSFTSNIEFGLNDASGGSYFGMSSTGTINDSQWHHIVAVFDGTEEYIYIDGVLDSRSKAPGHTIAQTSSAASIGENTDAPGRIWDGRISEVAIFTYALNPSQIQQVYNAAAPAPVLTQQPQVATPVYEGSILRANVTAIGGQPMSYQWTRNGVALPGQSANALMLSNVTAAADNGSYAVVVANAFGATTSSVVSVSVVASPPAILQQPLSVVRAPGGNATFTVLAGGSLPISYQWARDSIPITGATESALALSPVQSAEAGTYSVTLTNRHGSTNSAPATLSLAPVSDWQALVMSLGPYIYWQLNESSGIVVSDVSSGLNGVIVGNMVLGAAGAGPNDGFVGFGGAHQAFQFDGATSFVNCGTQVDLNVGSHTILTWVKSQPFTGGGYNAILTKGDSSYRLQRAYSGEFLEDSDDGINPATIGVRYLIGTRTVDDGTWHMLTCVLDQGVRSLYFDGSLDVSGAGYGTTAIVGYPVYIGENAQARGRVWPGWISDVALFNRALSAAEIAGLWQFALSGASAPAIGTQPVSQDVFVGQPVTVSVSAVTGSAPFGYQWRKDGAAILGATSSGLIIGSAGYADAGNYDVVVTNGLGLVTSLAATLTVWPPATFANLTNGLVLHLKFDGDFTDSSGFGNNGIPGGTPTFVPGRIGQAVHVGSFKTISSYNYVAVPYSSGFDFSSDFSVSLWVRYTGLPNDLPMIGNATGSTYSPGWVLTDDTGKLEWSLEATNSSGARISDPVSSSPVMNDGNWHQIVMVVSYSGDAVTNYVDGVCVEVSPLGPLTSVDTSTPIVIGQDPSGAYSSFGGASAEYDIDDIGIWARVLSQLEAESIYAAGQYGQSFDLYGPVVLRIQLTPTGVLVLWPAGTLLSADDPAGPWSPVVGSSPPLYQVTPLMANKFYRVQL